MSEIIMVGLYLAKHVFQVNGADAAGQPVLRKKLRRRRAQMRAGRWTFCRTASVRRASSASWR